MLYVTGALNHAWAIDARTGTQIWHYQRQLPAGLKVCCGMVNRGFAVYGDRLFMVTLDAHFVALEMKTGKVIYDIEMAAAKDGFAATGAPLVVNDKVIVGVAGGEFANRGFIDAYNPATGERLWRFYTIPAPGEPGSESWQGEIWQRGGGPTWLTGTYDPQLNLLYWGIGNPNPDWDGDEPSGRQPLHRLARRARSGHRKAEVALPVHAARHARLGRERDSGARRPHDRRPRRARSS